jgi:protein SCO1
MAHPASHEFWREDPVLTRPSCSLLGLKIRKVLAHVCALFSIAAIISISVLSVLPPVVRAEAVPKELTDIGITEHLGSKVSVGELHFKDETGKDVVLSDYLSRGRPVILAMVYYECPNLCNMLLNGLSDGIKNLSGTLNWTPGNQFDIVAVSINPNEKPELAAKKKAAYVQAYGRPETARGWHFLTGEESQIKKLASEVGFGYRWVKEDEQYAHASAIYALTPEGRISRYLYGIEFSPRDLRLALLEASNGKIGSVVDRFLMFCYHYDPKTQKYSLVATRVMDSGAAGTILVFGGYLVVFWRKERRRGA